MLREQKGITLVALVITIIVLLILAGVSISLVVGNNGVLTRASGAVVSNTAAGLGEGLQLAFSTAEMEYRYASAGNPGHSRSPYYATTGADSMIADEFSEKGTFSVVSNPTELDLLDSKGVEIDDVTTLLKTNTYGLSDEEEQGTTPETFDDNTSYVVEVIPTGNTTEKYYFLVDVNGGATTTFLGYVKVGE